jgi:hypothetical protein
MSKSNALLKVDVISAELKQLWSPSDNDLARYEKFVHYSRQQIKHVFPKVDWNHDVWEI